MPQTRSLKRKADSELAPLYLKRAKMTPSHEPKLKSCLQKARGRGASKKLTKKKKQKNGCFYPCNLTTVEKRWHNRHSAWRPCESRRAQFPAQTNEVYFICLLRLYPTIFSF
ncbi:hypothetical protein PoB_002953500 [Plakobranchus ocellatus]|uniref:Uncharacterized protein n=1 Tax=Plakobranchus ocellatus TaxID=259542 RepID=A0AAV4A871_9GAST|nr:hypothetical protein PoB_002953500 [Plakobranchus ocellatus]